MIYGVNWISSFFVGNETMDQPGLASDDKRYVCPQEYSGLLVLQTKIYICSPPLFGLLQYSRHISKKDIGPVH